MRRRFPVLATAAVLAALLAVPLAAEANHPRRPRCNNLRAIARVVQLSPAQVQQAQALFGELRQTIEPLRQQIPPLREALEDLLEAETPEAAAVGEAVIDIDALRDQIQDARRSAVDEFEGLLTTGQLERWEEFQEHCREGYQHGD